MLTFLVLRIYFAHGDYRNTCDHRCLSSSIGDGYCDENCMSPECNYDSSFYSDNKYLTIKQSDCFGLCLCSEEKLTNGVCDKECSDVWCGFDLGDCGHCDKRCFIENLESDNCIIECSLGTCDYYDTNPCKTYCAPGCSNTNDLYSDTCKKECLKLACTLNNFNSTCNTLKCSSECTYTFLYDSLCQSVCYNPYCNYDNGNCDCSFGCVDTSSECLTNYTYTDPCDNQSCKFKDGKCGFCSSGCFEENLGDGVCQTQCNTESCNYDHGDCTCAANCSFYYNSTISKFIQTGNSDECSSECLTLGCNFAIDFCNNSALIKSAVLNYLVNGEKNLDTIACELKGCTSEEINKYLDEVSTCEVDNICNTKECFYCMGQANKTFENCLRQSFDECLVCKSGMVEGVCFDNLNECPNGFEDNIKLKNLFGNSFWCLKQQVHYSKSNFKEIFVNSSIENNGDGSKEYPAKTLYNALVNVFATYTKIYLVNKEIDFFVDGSISIFISDIYDPLNSKILYETYELWIIGNYSNEEKTKVYWKDNLKISPLAKKFFLKNLEVIGKYVLKNNCEKEYCFYCPYIIFSYNKYIFEFNPISESDYFNYFSKNCSSYSFVDVFNFRTEAYLENIKFTDFRYQFNSFIKSSGVLFLENVIFSKMQAKENGGIIQLECTNNCIDSSFSYIHGQVIYIGAGYNDLENVTTGSFLKSSGIGNINIVNVKFTLNFAFNNFRSSNKGYLLFSQNHLGTIQVKDCEFYANYVNYLIYIDVSSLIYSDYRSEKGISLAYSQQHFSMDNISISSTYCSKGMIYYLMENKVHNINIANILIKDSVIGDQGIFSIINTWKAEESGIDDFLREIWIPDYNFFYIYIKARYLKLENIKIEKSFTGKNAICINNYPNSIIKNISISNIKDSDYNLDVGPLYPIINIFTKNEHTSRFFYADSYTESPELSCDEMILVSNSVNLLIDRIIISNIYCSREKVPSGLLLNNIIGETNINDLIFGDIVASTKLGVALTITDSNIIHIMNLTINNVINGDESVIKLENSNKIVIESAQIFDILSNFTSPFTVSNVGKFTLVKFSFDYSISNYKSGGCLSLITETRDSVYILHSGNFTKCISSNSKGGAIFIDSLMNLFSTSIQMNNVQVTIVIAKRVQGFIYQATFF